MTTPSAPDAPVELTALLIPLSMEVVLRCID